MFSREWTIVSTSPGGKKKVIVTHFIFFLAGFFLGVFGGRAG